VKAGYWYSQSDFPVVNINCSLFTHLFAAFASVDDITYQVTFPPAYESQFQSFTETVRTKHSSVKTLLSIGGGASDAPIFAAMASHNSSREAFINSSISVARTYNYSGLSLNWQYPYTSDQMADLGLLLTEWRAAVEEEANRNGNVRLLLTADVFYSPEVPSSLKYPIQAIVASLDWINVMAYDLYTPINSPNLTGPPAPLYNPTDPPVSVESGLLDWNLTGAWLNHCLLFLLFLNNEFNHLIYLYSISTGVPAGNIVLGLPFHGRSWALVNLGGHGMFLPAKGPVSGGDTVPYSKIVTMTAEKKYEAAYVQYYLTVRLIWIAFDGPLSIVTKVTNAKDSGLLGYFAWHVGDDTADWNLSTEGN
jgi:chitinase